MGGIPQLSRTEKLYVHVTGKNGVKRSRMACLELKSISWMEGITQKNFEPGELVEVLAPVRLRLQRQDYYFHGTIVYLIVTLKSNGLWQVRSRS